MEQPNLLYIEQLADKDVSFKRQLIAILKTELPKEIRIYQQSIIKKNNSLAAEIVHKIKHKIGVLGLIESHKMACIYEEELRNSRKKSILKFEKTLKIMTHFLKTI